MLTVVQVTDRETWRRIVPGLAIDDDASPVPCTLPGSDALADLRREGYLNQAAVVDAETIAALAAGVHALVDHELLPVFLWMYATPWRMFRAFDPFLRSVLGDYRVLPEIWTWLVPPSDDAAGWDPHRDQPRLPISEVGTPHSITIWVPLTDATVLNGCISLVPMNLDEDFRSPGPRQHMKRPQDVRTLPAPAGSMLAWNGNVMHWGGRSSRRAAGPRLSIACQFQRAREPMLGRPLLGAGAVPSLEGRAFLVARALLGYGQVSLSDDVRRLAEEVKGSLYEQLANG